jgi:hypothetical protein
MRTGNLERTDTEEVAVETLKVLNFQYTKTGFSLWLLNLWIKSCFNMTLILHNPTNEPTIFPSSLLDWRLRWSTKFLTSLLHEHAYVIPSSVNARWDYIKLNLPLCLSTITRRHIEGLVVKFHSAQHRMRLRGPSRPGPFILWKVAPSVHWKGGWIESKSVMGVMVIPEFILGI